MRLLLLALISFPLFAYQDCRITIQVDPVRKNIKANAITNGNGNDILSDAGSLTIDGLTGAGNIDMASVGLNLTPTVTRRRVWRCRFQNAVNRKNIVVNYSLVSLNGTAGHISNGTSSIPVSIRTKRLRFRRRDKVVTGDVEFQFDLSSPQMKQSGDYKGVLTINVVEN